LTFAFSVKHQFQVRVQLLLLILHAKSCASHFYFPVPEQFPPALPGHQTHAYAELLRPGHFIPVAAFELVAVAALLHADQLLEE
jgi:hypothetical protein